MILNLVLWCLFGLIAGTIAQFVMPGKDTGEHASPLGYLITAVLGIVGAIVGGFVSSRLLNWDVAGFNLPSLAVAIGGAVLVLALYRVVAGPGLSHTTRRR
jgi:uncharacterized membrane protein YeaQ/YmgE (transglycosylase-associated protein family)